MKNSSHYRVISHLDNPRRLLSLTLDECAVAMMGVLLLVVSNHKLLVGCFSFALYGTLKHLKQGQGPRFLWVLLYWHMPLSVSGAVVRHLPPSFRRVWRG